MKQTPRAIFIEPPREDMSITQVGQYAKPFILFGQGMRRPGVMDVRAFTDSVAHELEKIAYDPTNDFIVLTGSHLVLQFAVLAIASRYDSMKFLAFHAPTGDYVEKEFNMGWGRKDIERCNKRSTVTA